MTSLDDEDEISRHLSIWELDEDQRRHRFALHAKSGARRTRREAGIPLRDKPLPRARPRARDFIHVATPFFDVDMQKWKVILQEVADEAEITVEELLSQRRSERLTWPRHKAMYRLKNETTMSLTAIGRRMKRDHTTIIAGIRKHEQRMKAGLV